jgi:uncharacterized protein (TIRG00374 family)
MLDLKNPWVRRAGLIVAIVPFILIYRRIDFHHMVFDILPRVAWWTIPLVFAGTLLSMILQGTRWWLLLRAFTDEIPFLRALSYHFMSIYYATVLPTSAGQEVLRTLFVLKKAGAAVGWGAAWICKITALMLSLLFSVYGLFSLSKGSLPHGLILGISGFTILIILIGALSFSKGLTAPARRIAASILPEKILSTLENIREGVYQYRHKRKAMIETLVLTLFIQFILIFNASVIIMGITGKLYFLECLAFMPIIEIASMSVPITPNGMGIREGLIALMFSHIGLTPDQLGIYIIIALSANVLRLVGALPIMFNAGKAGQTLRGAGGQKKE